MKKRKCWKCGKEVIKKKKNENLCSHEYKVLGKCYSVNMASYQSSFDRIIINKVYYCTKCKSWEVEQLGTVEFVPSMDNETSHEMYDYIKELQENGIISNIAMNEKIHDLRYLD